MQMQFQDIAAVQQGDEQNRRSYAIGKDCGNRYTGDSPGKESRK